jgi:hypothetical protein
MRVPSLAGFRLYVGEAGARRRIGNADQNLAGRALNLPAGELRFTLQRLIAVGTVEFEFIRTHKPFGTFCASFNVPSPIHA